MRFAIALVLFALPFFALAPSAWAAGEALFTPATRPLTLPKGYGELGLGYRGAWGDYTFDLDGSRLRDARLVPFTAYRDQSAVVSATYGLTAGWELGMELPYVWRSFTIDRSPLIDTENNLITFYPESRTRGLGDTRFFSTVAFGGGFGGRLALKTASGADNFFPTRLPGSRPAKYIGSGQSDLTMSALWVGNLSRFRIEGELAYRARLSGISNYLLADFNPPDELLGNLSALIDAGSYGGSGLGVRYLHQASPSSISVARVFLPLWIEARPFELRLEGEIPVYGKDYPALFPAQLAERQPLLGPAVEVVVVYRWAD